MKRVAPKRQGSDKPSRVAARLFEQDYVVEASLHDDRRGLMVRTRDPDRFYAYLNAVVLEEEVRIETVTVADSDVRAVYQYLISEGET